MQSLIAKHRYRHDIVEFNYHYYYYIQTYGTIRHRSTHRPTGEQTDIPACAAKMSGVFPSLSARFGSTSSATVDRSSSIGINPLAQA